MKFKITLFLAVFCVASYGQSAPSTWFPQLEGTSHWQADAWGDNDGTLTNIRKLVRMNSSSTAFYRVFDKIKLKGVRIGTDYFLLTTTEEYYLQYSTYVMYYGYYALQGSNRNIVFRVMLNKDGQFTIDSYFFRDQAIPPDAWMDIEVDHALGLHSGANPKIGDRVEFAMSILYDQTFTYSNYYAEYYGNVTRSYLPTVNMYTDRLKFPPLYRAFDQEGVQNRELNVVFWPHNYTPVDVKFIADDGGDHYNEMVQSNTYLDYAYNSTTGSKALMLAKYTTNSPMINGIKGKFDIRPDARPLEMFVYVDAGSPSPNYSLVIANNRTAAMALNDLTNSKWNSTIKANISNPYNGGTITLAQLQQFMMDSRNISPSSYSTANKTNIRSWFLEHLIVNSTITNYETAFGLFFDSWSYDGNLVPREYSVSSWKRICQYSSNSTIRNQVLMYGLLHESGHCFNIPDEWSSCGANYASSNCLPTSLRDIMSYAIFFGSPTMTWNQQCIDWYKKAPESWVAPGQMSLPYCMTGTTSPSFVSQSITTP